MEGLITLAFCLLIGCGIAFIIGIITLIASKEYRKLALKVTIISAILATIIIIIGIGACFSNLNLGGIH